MKKILVFLFLIPFALTSQGQDITAEQQQQAFDYIAESQAVLMVFNQAQINSNTIELNSTLTKEQKIAAKKKEVAILNTAIEKFEALPILEHDLGLRESTLSYANFAKIILNKSANYFYTKQANKVLNCDIESCLEAFKLAEEFRIKDLTQADSYAEIMSTALDKVAEVHLIELQEDNAMKELVMNLREVSTFIYNMNLGVYKGVTAYNKMALAMQKMVKTMKQKRTKDEAKKMLLQLGGIQAEYNGEIEKGVAFFNSLEVKDYKGDVSLSEAGQKLLNHFVLIKEKQPLVALVNLIISEEGGEAEVRKILSPFNEVTTLLNKYNKVYSDLMLSVMNP